MPKLFVLPLEFLDDPFSWNRNKSVITNEFYRLFKEDVSLHSQPKVRFREYFVYFLMRHKSKEINHSGGGKNINFTYLWFPKVINKLVKKIVQ